MRCTTPAIIALLAACGGEMTPDVGGFTVTDSSGVQIVESFSPSSGDRPVRGASFPGTASGWEIWTRRTDSES